MDSTLFRYIWRHSSRQQIFILCVTCLSFPLIYYSLDLPKQIINQALQGTDWPQTIFAFQLDQVPYLLLLCFTFLALVIINNGIKFFLNTYKNALGERMLRRLRYELYQRVLRFRLPRFRQVSQGEIIPMITSEVEPLGAYIGDAVALPAFQGGTLLVYLYFIFAQDVLLGTAAIALYPLQMWLIPKLQRRVNQLARERVINTRRMADRIGETISGVRDVHANDVSAWHLADISERLYIGFDIRFRGLQLKFLIKFINNLINQLTPFFFYSIGGYLVIRGELSFGALVAVLAAYKDLAGPWKELLDFYQSRADMEIKYQTVIENFDVPEVRPLPLLIDDATPDQLVSGDIVMKNLSYAPSGSQQVAEVGATIPTGALVAVVGEDTDGRSELLELIGGLIEPTGGEIAIGGRSLHDLPESVIGRSLAYIGSSPYVFTETIRGNVAYGLRHRPQLPPNWPSSAPTRVRFDEAKRTGNTEFPMDVSWEDLAEAGVKDRAELDARALELLEKVGLIDDVFRLGLGARIDPSAEGAPVEALIHARKRVAERLAADPQAADVVEQWRPDAIVRSATLAENVLFALPADPTLRMAELARDPLVISYLERVGLADDFRDIGIEIARLMVELFAEVSADNTLMAEFSFISAEELPNYDRLLKQIEAKGRDKISARERADLTGLAFEFIPARHRLDVINEQHLERIIAARPVFREMLTKDGGRRFIPFDPDTYIAPLPIEDNLIFGKPRLDRRGSRERIDAIIRAVIAELGLQPQIRLAGLDYHVGVGGSRLSVGQRQRIAVARALMRRPRIAIFDGLFDGLGAEMVSTVRQELPEATVIVGTTDAVNVPGHDLTLRLSRGRLVEGARADAAGTDGLAGG